MTILVTGAAGFIGFHLTNRLLRDGVKVVGIDNLNNYYDVRLKIDRLKLLQKHPNFTFYNMDLENQEQLFSIFKNFQMNTVINLAAQAGVRYSILHPHAYVHSNIYGFLNILEACKAYSIKHLIYASSSSVYGSNTKSPFSTSDSVDHPISMYAASKKTNELMAHTYSHLYNLPTTGLRFFTVYGPWGRPDMAYYSFTKKIIQGSPVQVYNYGNMKRDFTYIDDIVEAIMKLLKHPPKPNFHWHRRDMDISSSYAPYKIYNIGHNQPVNLLHFIHLLETIIGKKAIIELLPMQPGDVKETYADITDLQKTIGFTPSTPLQIGLHDFVKWYKHYHASQ